MILLGFSFKDVHSSTVGLYLNTPGRTIKPPTRVNEYEIAGRDGTVDYGDETYGKMNVTSEIAYKASPGKTLRQASREIAHYLSGTGNLIFDDEPDKEYRGAKIVEAPTIDELANADFVTLTWEVQPFSQAVIQSQHIALNIPIPADIAVQSNGTIRCPMVIRIINRGDTATDLVVMRTAET